MLTSDLLLARVYRGEVRPRYIDPSDTELLALAEQLLDIFGAHVGRARFELEQELDDLLGTGTDFLLHRGLAKLLFNRATFETAAEVEPETLREDLFAAAADAYRRDPETAHFAFLRDDLLAESAARHGIGADRLERCLYADLKDEQELADWQSWTPSKLLERYNIALAQGVLLRATELEIQVGKETPRRHRALFQRIKFFQLMHRIEADGKGWVLRLDGPLSLFRASGKYGLRMASFLPTLLHLKQWSLEAKVLWGPKRVPRTFKLSSEQGLVPFGRLTGQWQPDELAWLPEQLAKLDSDWEVSTSAELVNLGGEGVLVPDYAFTHSDGTHVVMEVFGFWRKGAVESRLKLLRRHGPENLILALSKALAAGQERLEDLAGEVYIFRSAPIARQVLKLLERFRADGRTRR